MIEILEYWVDILKLNDWEISVETIDVEYLSDDSELAKCFIDEDSMSASIILAGKNEEEIENSIKHELLHIYLQPLRSLFMESINQLNKETQEVMTNIYNRTEEKIVLKLELLLQNHEQGEII